MPDEERPPLGADRAGERPPPRDPEEIRARLQEMQRELDERRPVHDSEPPRE